MYKENLYLSDEKNILAIVFYLFFHFTYDHPFRLDQFEVNFNSRPPVAKPAFQGLEARL